MDLSSSMETLSFTVESRKGLIYENEQEQEETYRKQETMDLQDSPMEYVSQIDLSSEPTSPKDFSGFSSKALQEFDFAFNIDAMSESFNKASLNSDTTRVQKKNRELRLSLPNRLLEPTTLHTIDPREDAHLTSTLNDILLPHNILVSPSLDHMNYKYQSLEPLISDSAESLITFPKSYRQASSYSLYSPISNYEPCYPYYNFLMVDDNIINLKILSRVLYRLYPNCFIRSTTSPDEIRRLICNSEGVEEEFKYDVLFLDIDMPELSGIDLAQIIRSDVRNDYLALIAVTTSCTEEEIKLYESIGIDTTLPKPITRDYDWLIHSINSVIDSRA